jgi:transposase-like protein
MQYGHWAYEIKAMRDAVQLWDALAQKRLDLVSDIIAYSPDGQRAFVRSSMEWDREIAVTKDMRGRGVAIVGLMLLQAIANRRLAYRVGTHVLLDADRRKLSLDISPTDIRGLMWLQFARAFTSNRRYRQCAQCGKWFELAPNEPVSKELSHRVSAKHCSGACRSKAHREKQKKAQSLAQEGNPVSKIAELLDSDESTVAGWIRKGKGES